MQQRFVSTTEAPIFGFIRYLDGKKKHYQSKQYQPNQNSIQKAKSNTRTLLPLLDPGQTFSQLETNRKK